MSRAVPDRARDRRNRAAAWLAAHRPPRSAAPVVLAVTVLLVVTAVAVDLDVQRAVATWSDGTRAVFSTITKLGKSDWLLIPAGLFLLASLLPAVRRHALPVRRAVRIGAERAIFLFVSVAASGLVVLVFKYGFGRPRPRMVAEHGHAFVGPTFDADFASFPSGHATTMGALAMVFLLLAPRYGGAIAAASLVVAFSRVVVNAHFLSDVVAGYALGLWVTWLVAWAFARERIALVPGPGVMPRPRRHRKVAFIRDLAPLLPFRLATVVRLPDTSPRTAGPDTAPAIVALDRHRTLAMSGTSRVSVVIPAKNEMDNLAVLIPEIHAAFGAREHEVIVVDDGSTDGTAGLLATMRAAGRPVRHVRHEASCGQSAAVRSGLLAARGDIVATIDGDGQNDPAYIPALVAALEAGGPQVALAAGQRLGRTDGFWKTRASRFANAVRGAILADGTRDSGCGLKAVRREVFLLLPYFDSWHRFLPALVIREGYRVVHVDVVDRHRRFGKSNYGIFDRGLRGVLDLFGVWWLRRRRKRIPVASEIGSGAGAFGGAPAVTANGDV